MKFLLNFFFVIALTTSLRAQITINAEVGAAQFGYNDVRISGEEGTKFSLSSTFKNDPAFYYRGRLGYTLAERHTLLLLYAPLEIKGSGNPAENIFFEGKLFEKGIETKSTWKFNSYRLSYQYAFISKEKIIVAAGLTAKIRDAKIKLDNRMVSAEKTNVGVVPLIRFYTDWNFARKTHFILDGDALVGMQGRAEDILIAIGYDLNKRLNIDLGYRLLEGGADNDEVYNFSLVNYAALGINYKF